MSKLSLTDFKLGPTLGVGTVGTIYQAEQLASGRIVALKVLLPTVCEDPLVLARFEREMLILSKLSHAGIVEYYGGGRDGNQWFYAMELVAGGTLKQLLAEQGPLSWREVMVCGTQICSALQHAHNHGVIHRDLKPGNLYLTRDGRVKLGDFGIARDVNAGDLTSKGLTVGTYAYMSPEQILGQRDVTGKSDLYALGCLLFEMLTGHSPYQGANFAQLFEQHLNAEPPHVRDEVPDCPPALDQLLVDLLAKDPDARPFNARAVQGSLYQLLDGEAAVTAVAPEQGPAVAASLPVDQVHHLLSQRVRRLSRRDVHPKVSWWSLAGLGVIVALLVFAAWWLGRYGP